MKKYSFLVFLQMAVMILSPQGVKAEEYIIDPKKALAFIQFKVGFLGFNFVVGRFNRLGGSFNFDENELTASKVSVMIDTASINTNDGERDKYLRSDEFLDVKKFPRATFVSTSIESTEEDTVIIIRGDFTLHGITRQIKIEAKHIDPGKEPLVGFRRRFEGRTRIAFRDFDINFSLRPILRKVDLFLSIEGIKKIQRSSPDLPPLILPSSKLKISPLNN